MTVKKMIRKPSYPSHPKFTQAEMNARTFKRVGKTFYKQGYWSVPSNNTYAELKGVNVKKLPTDGNELVQLIDQLNTLIKDVTITFEVEHSCCGGDDYYGCECETSSYMQIGGSVEITADEELIEAYNSYKTKEDAYQEKLKTYQKNMKLYDAQKAEQAAEKRTQAEYKRYLKLKQKYEDDGTA